MSILLRATFRVASLRRIFYGLRDLLTSPQGQAPPGEPQPPCPAHAEFVICDCTIEWSFRYAKCELALECPRLWSLEARLKLLGMVMLVYAFLLSLLNPLHHELVEALLRFKCHRTGKRCQEVQAPLYRLRWALSRLWDDYRPRLTCFIPLSDDPLAVLSLMRDVERISQNWG
jgi:hypothetical protein